MIGYVVNPMFCIGEEREIFALRYEFNYPTHKSFSRFANGQQKKNVWAEKNASCRTEKKASIPLELILLFFSSRLKATRLKERMIANITFNFSFMIFTLWFEVNLVEAHL